jgi:hypothetical protein
MVHLDLVFQFIQIIKTITISISSSRMHCEHRETEGTEKKCCKLRENVNSGNVKAGLYYIISAQIIATDMNYFNPVFTETVSGHAHVNRFRHCCS